MSSPGLRSNSISQILEILSRFWFKYSRTYDIDKAHLEAIKEVSQSWNIGEQTIRDLNWRRVGFDSIQEFRSLLEKWVQGDPNPLMDALIRHTNSQYHQDINKFFSQEKFGAIKKSSGRNTPREKFDVNGAVTMGETFSFQLQPKIAKKLKVLSVVAEISPTDWLVNVLPEVIEKQYAAWLAKQS
ncbi:MAG TPA: hypothetical protein DIU00_09730 [Phycisphaerales bacterium]|nr:hypothetical protein [Phycisphaerales bacterium]